MKIKNARRLYDTFGGDPVLSNRVTILEDNELKITYFEVVSGTSGTITPPSQATFNSNEFGLSGNAILSEIDNSGKPTFQTPKTISGQAVTVSLNTTNGQWVTSGIYTSTQVAVIFSLKIKTMYYSNLNYFNIVEGENELVKAGTVAPLDYDSITDRYTTLMNTNRLIGRYDANSGVMQEIKLGSLFSIDTDTLNVDALKRDGSNANSDVDLGNYGLNAKQFHVKGTGGAGHIGFKHQSSNITANANESSLGADSSGNPQWKNDGGTVDSIELQSNRKTTMTGYEASNVVYLTAKAVYDWAVATFTTTSAVASQITTALTGYLTSATASATYQLILTATNFGAFLTGLTAKTTPIDADEIVISDSADSNKAKKVTLTNVKAFLKTYFDTIYTTTSAVATQITTALSGYATQAWVTSQGYITNVVTALGYTPENVANKSSSYTSSSTTTYANTKALVDGLATKQNSLGYTPLNAANNLSDLGSSLTARINLGAPFVLQTQSASFSPSSSTTYYTWGSINPTTTAANQDIGLGVAFRIIGAMISVGGNTAAGSTENITLQLRNTTQATSTSIGTFTMGNSISSNKIETFSFTGLSIDVGSTDKICMQFDTPAWSTAPTNTTWRVTLICILT